MRRLLALTLLAGVLGFGGPTAEAQEAEGAVAVCNWADFTQWGHDGFNWHWMGCNYGLFGRVQCRGEDIPRCWTAAEAKRDVRAFRLYTGLG